MPKEAFSVTLGFLIILVGIILFAHYLPRASKNFTLASGFSIKRYRWFRTSSGFKFLTKTISSWGKFLKLRSVFVFLSKSAVSTRAFLEPRRGFHPEALDKF